MSISRSQYHDGRRKEMRTQLCCPACSEVSEIDSVDFSVIAPGMPVFVICPICDTAWRITMEFYEIEEDKEAT